MDYVYGESADGRERMTRFMAFISEADSQSVEKREV